MAERSSKSPSVFSTAVFPDRGSSEENFEMVTITLSSLTVILLWTTGVLLKEKPIDSSNALISFLERGCLNFLKSF